MQYLFLQTYSELTFKVVSTLQCTFECVPTVKAFAGSCKLNKGNYQEEGTTIKSGYSNAVARWVTNLEVKNTVGSQTAGIP